MKAIIGVGLGSRPAGRKARVALGLFVSLFTCAASVLGEEAAATNPKADGSTASPSADPSTSSPATRDGASDVSDSPSSATEAVATEAPVSEAVASGEPAALPAPAVKRTVPAAKTPAKPGAGSPILPWIARGDAEFVARDFAAACDSYQSGSTVDPKEPVPYLRLVECNMALGKLDEAVQFSELALRVIEPRHRLRLIALSRQAVVFEAKADIEKALALYKMLLSAAASSETAVDRALFEGIARERSAVLEVRRKELADAAIVKARIDEELAEATPKGLTGAPPAKPSL